MTSKGAFLGGFLVGVIGGVIGGYLLRQHTEPEVDLEATEEVYKKKVNKLKKKLKDAEETIATKEKTCEMLRALRKSEAMDQMSEGDKSQAKLYPEGYPETEAEIEAYNLKNKLHDDKEFLTEDEYMTPDEDYEKVEINFYSNGLIANAKTGDYMDVELEVGNLINGMGTDDPVRYIRNKDIGTDYKVVYVDHDSDLPVCD